MKSLSTKDLIGFMRDRDNLLLQFHKKSSLIWAGAHMVFFFVLTYGLGYIDSLIGRFLSAFLLIGIKLLPSPAKIRLRHRIYLEFACAFGLPIIFTFLLLENQVNAYWFGSMVFCGLCYGLLANPLVAVLVFPIASCLIVGFYPGVISAENLTLSYLSILVGSLMLTIALCLKYVIFMLITADSQTKIELAKAEHDLVEAEQARKNLTMLKKREEIISSFARKSLVTELSLNKDPREFPPQFVRKSVLFTDIHNFTQISDTIDEVKIHDLLNEYFGAFTESVFSKPHAEVDKFIGDAAMATVLKPSDCIEVIFKFIKMMDEIRAKRLINRQMTYGYGIGAAYGQMLEANFGNKLKLDRTVVGTIVNVAARLEQLTRLYSVRIIVTSEFLGQVPGYEYYRAIDMATAKGLSRPIKIYEIYGSESSALNDFKRSSRDAMEELVAYKAEGNSIEYNKLLHHLIKICPENEFDGSSLDSCLNHLYQTAGKLKKVA